MDAPYLQYGDRVVAIPQGSWGRNCVDICPSVWLTLALMKLVCIISLICLALHGSLVYADSPLLPRHQIDTIPMEVELADPTMATTPEKRHQLQYLVSCALPKSLALYTQQGTERFTFPGQMGLAPGWLYHPM